MDKYEQLINRLANKTLNFGCGVIVNGLHGVCVSFYEGQAYIKFANAYKSVALPVGTSFVKLGQPIMLGDVLERRLEQMTPSKGGGGGIPTPDQILNELMKLVLLWMPCGIDKPLQEIYKKSRLVTKKPVLRGRLVTMDECELEDPNAESLFTLLFTLFPENGTKK